MKQYSKIQQISGLMLFLTFFFTCSSAARIIYVDDDAFGSNDGSSWENAYIYLQDALYEASFSEKPIEIRVAQGIYTPDKGMNIYTGDCCVSFELLNGVTISGGYAGISTSTAYSVQRSEKHSTQYVELSTNNDPNARNIELYKTILSGDLYHNDSNDYDPNNLVYEPSFSDNSYHVVTYHTDFGELSRAEFGVQSSESQNKAVLDGFTITAGNARGDYLNLDSTSKGGGIYISGNQETWESGNQDTDNPINGYPDNLNISNCTFTINAAYEGGAIYNTNSDPNISNCKFIENNANYYYSPSCGGKGGAIYNDQSSPILTNCEFIENLASSGAGIYFNNDSNAVLTNCRFLRNTANLDYGGGIFNTTSNPILIDCNFCENSAAAYGGGIANANFADPILDNCIFQANWAKLSGGAIYNFEKSDSNITNCIFNNNSAGTGGGAIANDNSDPNLKNCTFSGNHSKNGGAFDNSYGSPIFSSCVFSNNSAVRYGGAMQNYFGKPILKNCIFSGNISEFSGGALFNAGGDFSIINCTAADNFAGNLGLFAYNSTFIYIDEIEGLFLFVPGNIEFLNCIIWNGENAILNKKDSIVEINYSDVQNGLLAIDDPQQGLIWGNGNIDSDPLFIESGFWIDVNDPNIIVEPDDPNAFWLEGDYHLKSTAGHYDPNSQTWIIDDVNSPCLDAGDPNSPFENEPLPNGNRINMGAYGDTIEASMSPGEALVAHWALDEIDGVIAYDSASDNHAIVNEPQWTEGKIDGALRLNGLRSYLDCSDSKTFGTRQMTIAMWLKPSHMGGMRYILSRATTDLSEVDYTLMIDNKENIAFEIGQDDTESVYIPSNGTVPLEQWTHIAITLNGSVASIYINGQLDTSSNYPRRTTAQDYNLTIGSHQGSTLFYNGTLDDIRFYNIALNQQQIELLAQ